MGPIGSCLGRAGEGRVLATLPAGGRDCVPAQPFARPGACLHLGLGTGGPEGVLLRGTVSAWVSLVS